MNRSDLANKTITKIDISNRLELNKIEGSPVACIIDKNPPIYIVPFVLDPTKSDTIKYIFLHQYHDVISEEIKTSTLGVSTNNADSMSDAVKTFVANTFSIPKDKIDTERLFYLGEIDLNLSIFSAKTTCFGVNLSGFLRNDEVKVKLSEDSNLIRVPYYDIMKGHYLDAMTMASIFQLISYFML